MLNAHSDSEQLKKPVKPSTSTSSTATPEITRRGFLAASAALLAGGCAQSENADDLKSGEQINALNNLITDSGWKCVQKEGYAIIGFVYDDKGKYARTVFAHPDGTFTIYANSQGDSKAARGTTTIETWEAASIEKFNSVEEAAVYIIGLSKSANE